MRQIERQRKELIPVKMTLIQKQQAGGENMHSTNVIGTPGSKCQFAALGSFRQQNTEGIVLC